MSMSIRYGGCGSHLKANSIRVTYVKLPERCLAGLPHFQKEVRRAFRGQLADPSKNNCSSSSSSPTESPCWGRKVMIRQYKLPRLLRLCETAEPPNPLLRAKLSHRRPPSRLSLRSIGIGADMFRRRGFQMRSGMSPRAPSWFYSSILVHWPDCLLR